MEHIKFNFKCQIARLTDDGWTAILEDDYLVKFRDSKCHYLFNVSDVVDISIENISEAGKEEIKDRYAIIYVKLVSFISNGIMFKEINSSKSFFWTKRGMITHKRWEDDDIFKEGDILKIIIKKI